MEVPAYREFRRAFKDQGIRPAKSRPHSEKHGYTALHLEITIYRWHTPAYRYWI